MPLREMEGGGSHLVCFDGCEPPNGWKQEPFDDVFVFGRHCGTSAARNRCLIGTSSQYLMPIDADDIAICEGIAASLEELQKHRSAKWAAFKSPDFTVVPGDGTPFGPYREWTAREWRKWEAVQWWESHQPGNPSEKYFQPFRSNCVIYETAAVKEAGGWPAMPVSEDLGLLLKVNSRHPGIQTQHSGIHRRLHPQQTTQNEGYEADRAIWDFWLKATLPR